MPFCGPLPPRHEFHSRKDKQTLQHPELGRARVCLSVSGPSYQNVQRQRCLNCRARGQEEQGTVGRRGSLWQSHTPAACWPAPGRGPLVTGDAETPVSGGWHCRDQYPVHSSLDPPNSPVGWAQSSPPRLNCLGQGPSAGTNLSESVPHPPSCGTGTLEGGLSARALNPLLDAEEFVPRRLG